MTIQKLAQHARDIANAFGVTLDECVKPGGRSMASPDLRLVRCTPIDSEEGYATAMHEIGHCLAPSGLLRTGHETPMQAHRLKLEEEDAAWEWARHYALDWSPTMEHIAQVARSTYDTVHEQMKADPVLQVIEAAMGGDAAEIRRILTAPAAPLPPKPATVNVQPVSAFAGKIKWKERGR